MEDLNIGVNAISAGTTRGQGEIILSNSNGLTFGLNGQTVTGSYTVPSTAGLLSAVNLSAETTSNNLSAFTLSNSNGLTFGLNGSVVTGSHNGLTSQSNQNVTAGNGGFAFQTLSFSNVNGFSFGTSAGSAITGSYTVPTVTNSSLTLSDNATSMTIGRLAFSQSNGLTLSLSTTTGGSATLVGSYTVPTVTNSSWTVSDNGTSGSVGRLAFTNLNGVTLSLSTGAGGSHTIVGSHNALTSQSTQFHAITLGGNTAGTSTFHATNNASIFLHGGNNITLSGNGSSITISAGAGGGTTNQTGPNIGVSNLGNTAGSTGTISTGDYVLVGSGGITLSQSTAAAGSHGTVTIHGPQQQTMSMFPPWPVPLASSSAYTGATTTTAGGSRTSYSLYISPLEVDHVLSFNTAGMQMSFATVAGTGSMTNAHMFGLYRMNAGTALSLVETWQMGIHVSQNSVTAQSWRWWWGTDSNANTTTLNGNVSASFAKLNHIVLHSQATSLAESQYWLGYMQTISTGGAAIGSFSMHHATGSQTTAGSLFGTNVSVNQLPFHGIVSGTQSSNAAHVNIMPSSIHTSAITGTGGSSQNRQNVIFFGTR